MIVRSITQDDHEPWFLMRVKLWPDSAKTEPLSKLQELFDPDSFRAWIALEGNRYCGFAEASVRPYANGCVSRPVVFLEGILDHLNAP